MGLHPRGTPPTPDQGPEALVEYLAMEHVRLGWNAAAIGVPLEQAQADCRREATVRGLWRSVVVACRRVGAN
jgi:hypothetical protein